MNRSRLLVENIFYYGGLQALSKLLPFLFLPFIVTLLESPDELGKFDMFSMLVAISSTIASMGIYDAGFREIFDNTKRADTKEILSTILLAFIFSGIIVAFIVFLFHNKLSTFLWTDQGQSRFILLALIAIPLYSIQQVGIMPVRIRNDRKGYGFYMISNALLYYLLSIILLYRSGTAFSMMLATTITSFFLVASLIVMNSQFFRLRLFSFSLLKELLKIGLPLVPVFVSFWLLQSISRFYINDKLGLNEQGIYSLANRVASVSLIFQLAFSSGFSFFAFSTMNSEDQIGNRTKLLDYILVFSLLFSFGIILLQDVVFNLFDSRYYNARYVFPFLLFLPLLLVMYQTVSNQFTIAKKTYINMVVLIIGVGIAFVGNIILIDLYGLKGASFSSFLAYYAIYIISYIVASKLGLLYCTKNNVILNVFVLVYFLMIFIDIIDVKILTLVFLFLTLIVFYKLIKQILDRVRVVLITYIK